MEEVAQTPRGRRSAAREGLRPTPFLVTVIMIAVTGTIWMIHNPSARQAEELAAQVRSLKEDVARLEAERDALRRRRHALGTDLGVIEHEARRQFGLVKPGEVAVIPDSTQAPRAPEPKAAPRRTPWQRYAIYGLVGVLVLTIPVLLMTGAKE